MILYDLLQTATYDTEFSIYITNVYGQNLQIGRGERKTLMSEDTSSTF